MFGIPTIIFAETGDYLLLQKGSMKLMRAGQSWLIWQPGLKLGLMPGDRLHTGSDTRVTLRLKQDTENVELYSQAFLEVDGISEEQRSVALLVGKGNFDLPPAPETLLFPVAEDTGTLEKPPVLKETENSDSVEQVKRDTAVTSQKYQKVLEHSDAGPSRVKGLMGKLGKLGKQKLADQKVRRKRLKGLINLGKKDKRKLTGTKLRKKRFMVRTISAVIGVRGTEFVVAAAGDTTNVLTVTGQVSMASTELPDHEVVIPNSSVSRVTPGNAPSKPVEVPPSEQQQIVEAENPAGFAGVEFGPAQSIETLREQGKDSESDLLEQLEDIDEIQALLESVQDITSQTRTMILKTNITQQ
jgi:hypothetical protein